MHLPSISRTTKSWCGHYWEIVGGMIQDTGRAFHEQLICTQRTSTREHLLPPSLRNRTPKHSLVLEVRESIST